MNVSLAAIHNKNKKKKGYKPGAFLELGIRWSLSLLINTDQMAYIKQILI